ncbi:putative PAS/PAC sensor domain protein, partial [Desulfosporosinus sp. OT]
MEYKMKLNLRRVTPMRMVILYALISGVWILFSDRLLGAIVTDHQLLLQLSIVKGWFYVTVMAIVLYFLFQWGYNSLLHSEEILQKEQEYLERYRLLAEN